jgi:hypothetical protein
MKRAHEGAEAKVDFGSMMNACSFVSRGKERKEQKVVSNFTKTETKHWEFEKAMLA